MGEPWCTAMANCSGPGNLKGAGQIQSIALGCCFLAHIFPIPEYALCIDVLQDLDVTTTTGKFRLCLQVVKPIIVGPAKWETI